MGKIRLRGAALALAAALLTGCNAGTQAVEDLATGNVMAAATEAPAPGELPTDAATETPTATPKPDAVRQRMDAMTLRQKVGQLFVVRPDSLDLTLPQDQINDAKADGTTTLSNFMKTTLLDYPVGGVVLFTKNITDPAQVTQLIGDLQLASEVPLLVGVDEEGGAIARLGNHLEFTVPQYESAMAIGNTGDPANAREMGKTIGGYIKQYGFNLDFAPDADVNTNPDNPVIGDRAFSADPQVAADMVAAAVSGFQEVGVVNCIKHFPGHGDTGTDSHYGCATAEKTWAEMKNCEMLPFMAGIQAGTDLVMMGHITTPNVTTDGLPASLSSQMITEKLRGELGYDGIVITDSLAMEAITDDFSAADAAKMTFEAGTDILLMPNGLCEAFDALVDAVESGQISEERLDESVYRILSLKQKYGLL